jgi:energy-coupling factor transporter ATP-binding protein EcfA2
MTARARLLLFDEPTSGLEPITARTVDAEIIKLRDLERITSLLVTHQLRDAFYLATHEARHENDRISIVPASAATPDAAEFIMLKDGQIYSRDPQRTFAGRPIRTSRRSWQGGYRRAWRERSARHRISFHFISPRLRTAPRTTASSAGPMKWTGRR